jgi:hypothetical protein
MNSDNRESRIGSGDCPDWSFRRETFWRLDLPPDSASPPTAVAIVPLITFTSSLCASARDVLLFCYCTTKLLARNQVIDRN